MPRASLRSLHTFCTVGRTQSFKAAADELFVTASAVSHQIKGLEQELGFSLFERKTRSIELTEKGALLLDELDPLFREIDSAVQRISGETENVRVTLTVPPFFASELLIPRLVNFRADNPDIDIKIDSEDVRPQIHPASSDASILLADRHPDGLRVIELTKLLLVPACAPDFKYKSDQPIDYALSESALIVHRPRRDAWKRWFRAAGYSPDTGRNIVELDTMFAVVRAAERGLGVALVPEALTNAWFESGGLWRLPGNALDTGDRYLLAMREEDYARPDLRRLTDWIVENFQD